MAWPYIGVFQCFTTRFLPLQVAVFTAFGCLFCSNFNPAESWNYSNLLDQEYHQNMHGYKKKHKTISMAFNDIDCELKFTISERYISLIVAFSYCSQQSLLSWHLIHKTPGISSLRCSNICVNSYHNINVTTCGFYTQCGPNLGCISHRQNLTFSFCAWEQIKWNSCT